MRAGHQGLYFVGYSFCTFETCRASSILALPFFILACHFIQLTDCSCVQQELKREELSSTAEREEYAQIKVRIRSVYQIIAPYWRVCGYWGLLQAVRTGEQWEILLASLNKTVFVVNIWGLKWNIAKCNWWWRAFFFRPDLETFLACESYSWG